MKKTVFITGASGFVGRNLVERFINDKTFSILGFYSSSDLCGRQILGNYGIQCVCENDLSSFVGAIDVCIHLASYGVAYGARDLSTMVDVNVGLSARIMEFAAKHSCNLFINTGSCFEYGSGYERQLIKETDVLRPDDLYAATKVACEDVLKVYSKILGIRMITIRPFSLYGRYENPQRIGPLVMSSLSKGIPLELTSGGQIRDYMDVSDLADAIYSLIINESKLKDQDTFNICSGSQITLKDFILMIADVFGLDKSLLLFGAKAYRQNESLFFAGDNSKLLSVVGEKNYKISKQKIFNAYKQCIKH